VDVLQLKPLARGRSGRGSLTIPTKIQKKRGKKSNRYRLVG